MLSLRGAKYVLAKMNFVYDISIKGEVKQLSVGIICFPNY